MHERLKGIEVRRLELGGVAASRWLRGHITGGAIAGEEVTDTTQTEPEARG
jgi:hypothetical protein